MIKLRLSVLSLIFIFSACIKEEVPRGQIEGQVENIYELPLSDAEVKIGTQPEISVKTDSSGFFKTDKIASGSYSILVSKKDYISFTGTITVSPNQVSNQKVILIAGETALSIYDTSLHVPANEGSQKIRIKSNSSWVISCSDNWLSCSDKEGFCDKTITILWSINKELNKRQGYLEFKSGTIIIRLQVIQESPLVLVDYSGSDGKPALTQNLFLNFNKPVRVNYIASGTHFYSLDSPIMYSKDSCGVSFICKYARLGGTYPISFSVTDHFGITYKDTVDISFFSKRNDLIGTISNIYINTDNQTCWVTTMHPNKLYLISIPNLAIIKEYSLEFPPYKMDYNKFNNRIYFAPWKTRYGDPYDPHLYIFDIKTENMRSILMKPWIDDHPEHPCIYPTNICFTNSGYGVILLKSALSSGRNFRVIDSALKDSIYYPANFDMNNYEYYHMTTNYNRSKILFNTESLRVYVVDGYSHNFDSFILPVSDMLGALFPNKTKNIFYVTGHDKQYIFDLDKKTIVGKISYVNRGGLGDFSYRENEENYFYMFAGWSEYFKFMDYNNAVTLKEFRSLYESMVSSATTDGKYLLCYGQNYIYQFDTEIFSQK